jgi:hypothetical protein
MERPSGRKTTIGVASSISKNGNIVNGQDTSDSEIADLNIALPYGISSSGVDGIRIQIITNDNVNNTVVGVIDSKRPPVRSGCLILYDKSGTRISLNGDGTISISGTVYINNVSFNDIINRITELERKIK